MKSKERWMKYHLKAYRIFLRFIGLSKDNTSRNLFRLFQVATYTTLVVFTLNLMSLTSSGSSFGTFGDFFGGVLNPILTFLTFMGLLTTIVLQQKELRLTREELKESSFALHGQLDQAKKSTQAEYFFRAIELMQSEEIRNARKLAFDLALDSKIPYSEWTQDQVMLIERLCHTFDTVAKLVRNDLIEEKMLLISWHTSIKKSWLATNALILNRREKEGNDVWFDFEWLYEQAKKY